MTSAFNAGVDAAAKIMEDLDRSGWFAAAIRARAKRDSAMTEDKILDAPEPDDPDAGVIR